jgi:hypothetical protein
MLRFTYSTIQSSQDASHEVQTAANNVREKESVCIEPIHTDEQTMEKPLLAGELSPDRLK